jgi:hypothetical protein
LFHSQGVAGLPAFSQFQRVFNNTGSSMTKLATGRPFLWEPLRRDPSPQIGS